MGAYVAVEVCGVSRARIARLEAGNDLLQRHIIHVVVVVDAQRIERRPDLRVVLHVARGSVLQWCGSRGHCTGGGGGVCVAVHHCFCVVQPAWSAAEMSVWFAAMHKRMHACR